MSTSPTSALDRRTFFKLSAAGLTEKHDGYFRDQCVFRPSIDIEDTMNVLVNYDTGATMSYSLNTFNAWEGFHVVFNGTKGRIEHTIVEQVYGAAPGVSGDSVITKVIPIRGAASCLVGITANRCFETGLPVKIADLVTGLERPNFAPMPAHSGTLPMPDQNSKPTEKVA